MQEYCQKNKKTVVYKFADKEGPDNRPIFRCALYIDDIKQTEGVGSSKKSAEQDAASKLVKKWRID